MPTSPSITVIRHNFFSKARGGATGKLARPNVLVGHWPLAGTGSEDVYAIYGNFFYQNSTEALFQGEGNIAFYSNVLFNAYGDGINIQPHNDVPRRVELFRNTVVARDKGIKVMPGDSKYAQLVAANVVFANEPILGGEQYANRTGSLADATHYLIGPTDTTHALDLSPKEAISVSMPADERLTAGLPDANLDFDGRIYDVSVAGAYVRPASKPLVVPTRR
jgi:hypothetical protein